MNTITTLKKLISIPSSVDEKNSDTKIAIWIYQRVNDSKIPVIKQVINKDRFNILAGNITNPDVLIVGHMDTVKPSLGWKTNPLSPIEKNGKIYGLGASDMKAGLAVMLSTLINTKPKNALFLFYCDEEYGFLGMKAFTKKYQGKIKPKIIISMDGENLQVGNACRGLIEFSVVIRGKSGHSGNPRSGVNAITNSIIALAQLRQWLADYSSAELGASTMNIASVNGGTLTGWKNSMPLLSREGNVIPDYCELVVEVRPATANLDLKLITKKLRELLSQQTLGLEKITIRHSLRSWITPKDQLVNFMSQTPKKTFADPMEAGYSDVQMLWEAFGEVPTFSFGPAEPGVAHDADEFVRISSIKKAEEYLNQVLQNLIK